jgi:ADP-ribose pyrophosphatase
MSDFSVVSSDTVLESYVFSVQRRVVRGEGVEFTRDIVHHPGAVAMVAEDAQGRVALIRQYRSTFDTDLWEIPAGTIEPDSTPLENAQRELEEEVGVSAENWHLVCASVVSPGWTDQRMYIFYASELTEIPRRPDGPEELAARVHWMSRTEVADLLATSEYFDATARQGLSYFLERAVGR